MDCWLCVVLAILALLPIFIRILFELYWILTRRRFVFDTRNGAAWCVITGAGNGLGLEYAKIFAEKGYNLLLLSLLHDELVRAKADIQENLKQKNLNKIRIETLQVDFSQIDVCYQQIEPFLAPYIKDISILLNNVGTDARHSDYFELEGCQRRNRLMVEVNLFSMTRMIEIILPHMKSNRNGLIISMSSGSALTLSPLIATYAASKAYIKTLMSALASENVGSGVTFVTLMPYWVSTNLTNNAPTNFFMPKAEVYAKSSLSKIRHIGWLETIGYFPHVLLYALTKMVGLIGGTRLDLIYSHLMMVRIRDYRKKLVVNTNDKQQPK